MMGYLEGETAAATSREVKLLRGQVTKIRIKARKIFGTSYAHGSVGPALRVGYLRLEPNPEWDGLTPALTWDEQIVLEALSRDKRVVDLPRELNITPGTVAHIEEQLKKTLGASTLVELVRAGYEEGLLLP